MAPTVLLGIHVSPRVVASNCLTSGCLACSLHRATQGPWCSSQVLLFLPACGMGVLFGFSLVTVGLGSVPGYVPSSLET